MNVDTGEASICAVIGVRNEATYLGCLLPALAAQNIDVVVIDNGSSDDTGAILRTFRGSPVIAVNELTFTGEFSLSEMLRAKQKVASALPHDWVVHQDADEILEHRYPGKNLRDAIQEADARGCNALNFEEFVFLPEKGRDYVATDYRKEILRYYFFRPYENRLNRAWKSTLPVTNADSGGHLLRGAAIRFSETNHILRHYIALSQEHVENKYLRRVFSQEDLARGWHGNRIGLSRRDLQFPTRHELIFRLPNSNSKRFVRSLPAEKHYWHWGV